MFDTARAPFQHDGKPGSIFDVLLGHGVHLEHVCGGNCACTTCHVIVRRGFDELSEASDQEEDLLVLRYRTAAIPVASRRAGGAIKEHGSCPGS